MLSSYNVMLNSPLREKILFPTLKLELKSYLDKMSQFEDIRFC